MMAKLFLSGVIMKTLNSTFGQLLVTSCSPYPVLGAGLFNLASKACRAHLTTDKH